MIHVEIPLPGVAHLKFDTQEQLTRAFIRVQEFYESPYDEIRGHHFTVEQFAQRYTATHGSFSYYTDWHGFNVPGHVVAKFGDLFFGDVTTAEIVIVKCSFTFQNDQGKSYIIGTHQEDEVTHEIAHALFYLDRDGYGRKAFELVCDFKQNHPQEMMDLWQWLVREGYDYSVIDDEAQAYLSTNELSDWRKDFGVTGDAMYHYAAPFRENFKRYYGGSDGRVGQAIQS